MSTPQSILQQMGRIREMERGTLCPMRGGRYFNHQTWERGRNVVRYVPAAQVPALRKRIAGYRRFLKLVERYVALRVQQSRLRHGRARPPAPSPAPRRVRSPPQPRNHRKK